MKYLENIPLELLSKELSSFELGGGLKLFGRIEFYSTKKAGNEKKESRVLDKKLEGQTVPPPSDISPSTLTTNNIRKTQTTLSSSAPTFSTTSSFLLKEEIPDKKLRKLLIDLIQTLNASQIYRDFSELSLDSFVTYPHCSIGIQKINSTLAEISLQNLHFLTKLWNEINAGFDGQLQKCKVYHLVDSSYQQELAEEGAIWSFDYFFCNEELRRICYFSCKAIYKYRIARSQLVGNYSEDEEDDDDGNMDESEDENGNGVDDYDQDSEEDLMDWR